MSKKETEPLSLKEVIFNFIFISIISILCLMIAVYLISFGINYPLDLLKIFFMALGIYIIFFVLILMSIRSR